MAQNSHTEQTDALKGDETSLAAAAALNNKSKKKFMYKFQQQQLEGWLFFPTFKCVSIFGFTIGSLMIAMGIIFLTVTSDVREVDNSLYFSLNLNTILRVLKWQFVRLSLKLKKT